MMNEKKVGYLKETILASKVVIVQVDKSKFSQLINAIKEIKWLGLLYMLQDNQYYW